MMVINFVKNFVNVSNIKELREDISLWLKCGEHY